MTQEEKAKAYDEALERAKECHIDGLSLHQPVKEVIEHIFPSLKESEDERIRKAIIDYFRWNPDGQLLNEFSNREVLACLEKQGEEIIPLKEIILNVWELGNYWKELTKGVCNTEHGRQLDYIVKHWKEGEHYIKSFGKKGEQAKEATYTHEAVTGNGNIKALVTEKVQLPKFKVGDTIRPKGSLAEYTIESISGECYHGKGWGLAISGDNEYELVRHKPVFEMKTPKESLGIDSDTYSKIVDECVYGEQKPVWSKQDETLLNCCLGAINTTDYFDKDNKDEMKNWLMFLKERVQPQSHWKPSENELEVLRLVAEKDGTCLMGLYEQLKKHYL